MKATRGERLLYVRGLDEGEGPVFGPAFPAHSGPVHYQRGGTERDRAYARQLEAQLAHQEARARREHAGTPAADPHQPPPRHGEVMNYMRAHPGMGYDEAARYARDGQDGGETDMAKIADATAYSLVENVALFDGGLMSVNADGDPIHGEGLDRLRELVAAANESARTSGRLVPFGPGRGSDGESYGFCGTWRCDPYGKHPPGETMSLRADFFIVRSQEREFLFRTRREVVLSPDGTRIARVALLTEARQPETEAFEKEYRRQLSAVLGGQRDDDDGTSPPERLDDIMSYMRSHVGMEFDEATEAVTGRAPSPARGQAPATYARGNDDADPTRAPANHAAAMAFMRMHPGMTYDEAAAHVA